MGGLLTKKNKDKSGSPAAAQQGGAKGEQADNGHGPTDGLPFTPDKKEMAGGDATPSITTTPAPNENGAAGGDETEKEKIEDTKKDDSETAVTTAALGADNEAFAAGEGETDQIKTPEATGAAGGDKKDDYVDDVPASPAVDQFIQTAETPETPADNLMAEAIADLAIQD